MTANGSRNLTYRPELYLGDSISRKKLDKLKKKLGTAPLCARCFLITIASNPKDQLDILDARQLAQPFYRDREIQVIGLAGDWEEALGLVERMTSECLRERGDCALKEYLLC